MSSYSSFSPPSSYSSSSPSGYASRERHGDKSIYPADRQTLQVLNGFFGLPHAIIIAFLLSFLLRLSLYTFLVLLTRLALLVGIHGAFNGRLLCWVKLLLFLCVTASYHHQWEKVMIWENVWSFLGFGLELIIKAQSWPKSRYSIQEVCLLEGLSSTRGHIKNKPKPIIETRDGMVFLLLLFISRLLPGIGLPCDNQHTP
jgi:hypothetical protein